jgi:hypothetical protein
MAYLLQNLECQIIKKCYEFCKAMGIEIGALCHDGMMLPKDRYSKGLLRKREEHIKLETGGHCIIHFTTKEFMGGISNNPPDDFTDVVITEPTPYEILKTKLEGYLSERTYCKDDAGRVYCLHKKNKHHYELFFDERIFPERQFPKIIETVFKSDRLFGRRSGY